MCRRGSIAVTLLLVAACAAPGPPGTPGPTPIQLTPVPSTPTPAATVAAPDDSPAPPESPAPPTPTPPPARFDPQAASLIFEPFAGGFGALTYLTHAGDGSGRLYAVERSGLIHLIESDGSVHPQPFLDLRDQVSAGGERGLLGLAFHPDYAGNGRFFVNYIDRQDNTIVSELARSNDSFAAPAGERIVLRIEQPFGNHNGGMIDFGPDGSLYVSSGDGGGAGDPLDAGQDLSTMLGSVLRIDIDAGEPYAIPADNPFVDQADARAEIWSWGLRNPWRFSFDAFDGALFIADVGQNRWEEINVEEAGDGGRNYGWNVMEGPECFRADDCDMTGLTMPVAWYSLDGPDCAVIGGYVYRGERYPELSGAYLMADHCSGAVRAIDAEAAKSGEEVELHELANAGLRATSFGTDEMGELYLVGLGGEIVRIGAR